MKNNTTYTRFLLLIGAAATGLALTACDVEKTEDGEMPEVSVEGGNMPEYDVDAPSIETGTKTVEMEVPTIDIEGPNEDETPATDE